MKKQGANEDSELTVFRTRPIPIKKFFISIFALLYLAIRLYDFKVSFIVSIGFVIIIGLCFVKVVASISHYNTEYIKFGSNFITIQRLSLFGESKTILFNQINQIEGKRGEIIIYYTDTKTAKRRKVVITLNIMEQDDVIELINFFESISGKLFTQMK